MCGVISTGALSTHMPHALGNSPGVIEQPPTSPQNKYVLSVVGRIADRGRQNVDRIRVNRSLKRRMTRSLCTLRHDSHERQLVGLASQRGRTEMNTVEVPRLCASLIVRAKSQKCRRHRRPRTVRATYFSKRPVASRSRSYRLASGNGGNQDSRRTVQSS
jgi:hypothetical protein